MFDDPRDVERDYFEKTQCFPIMHTIVIRNDVLNENPWVAQTILQRARSGEETLCDTPLGCNGLGYSYAMDFFSIGGLTKFIW